MTPRIFSLILTAFVTIWLMPVFAGSISGFSDTQLANLLKVAGDFGNDPQLVHGNLFLDDDLWYGYSLVIFSPTRRDGSKGCRKPAARFYTERTPTIEWKMSSLASVYWQSEQGCDAPVPEHFLTLNNDVDTYSVERFIYHERDILNQIAAIVGERTGCTRKSRLSGISIEYERETELYLHKVWYSHEDCDPISAFVKLGEKVEVVRAYVTMP